MATFFGEVSALSSRAVDEEELEKQPIYDIKLKYKDDSMSVVNCKLLIFSVGDIATAFAKSYLLPDGAPCLFEVSFSRPTQDTESLMYTGGLKVNAKGSKAAAAYTVNQDVVVCEISSQVPNEVSTDIFDTLVKDITFSEVLILTSCHMACFKTEKSVLTEKPFLKSLSTSQYRAIRATNIPRLEAPNFLSNFPAAALTEFEVKKIPALCVINYVDTNMFDSLNVKNFEAVLGEKFNVELVSVSDCQSKLSKLVNAAYIAESNLYT